MKRNQHGYALMIVMVVLFSICGTIMWIVISGMITDSIYSEGRSEGQDVQLYAREGLIEKYFSHLYISKGKNYSYTDSTRTVAKLISDEEGDIQARLEGVKNNNIFEDVRHNIQLDIGNVTIIPNGDEYTYSIDVNVVEKGNLTNIFIKSTIEVVVEIKDKNAIDPTIETTFQKVQFSKYEIQ